jgi:lincosamide nucleotidyltransferase A/C/D/E
MTREDVLGVLALLADADIEVWLDGGWGVDALLGEQTRPHTDVDIVVELRAVPALIQTLGRLGFATVEDNLPTRLFLRSRINQQIDVHPVTFDASGTGWQAGAAPDGGDCPYPANGFTTGIVAGQTVPCLTAEVQVQHHRGYEPSAVDRRDMSRLAARFRLTLPSPYQNDVPA